MKPFHAVLPKIAVDTETMRKSKVTKVHRGRAVITRVLLPDGYIASFVGAMGKGEAIRNALYQRDRDATQSSRSGNVKRRSTKTLPGHQDFFAESDFEVGPKSYTIEGVMRVWREPSPPGDEPFSPDDLHRDRWEAIVQSVTENIEKRPYHRAVALGPFMRAHGALAKAKLESDYLARAEAAYEARQDR